MNKNETKQKVQEENNIYKSLGAYFIIRTECSSI